MSDHHTQISAVSPLPPRDDVAHPSGRRPPRAPGTLTPLQQVAGCLQVYSRTVRRSSPTGAGTRARSGIVAC